MYFLTTENLGQVLASMSLIQLCLRKEITSPQVVVFSSFVAREHFVLCRPFISTCSLLPIIVTFLGGGCSFSCVLFFIKMRTCAVGFSVFPEGLPLTASANVFGFQLVFRSEVGYQALYYSP